MVIITRRWQEVEPEIVKWTDSHYGRGVGGGGINRSGLRGRYSWGTCFSAAHRLGLPLTPSKGDNPSSHNSGHLECSSTKIATTSFGKTQTPNNQLSSQASLMVDMPLSRTRSLLANINSSSSSKMTVIKHRSSLPI